MVRAKKYFVATMETNHYSWTALGDTEAEARTAIEKLFFKHIKNAIGLSRADWFMQNYFDGDFADFFGIHITELAPGEATFS